MWFWRKTDRSWNDIAHPGEVRATRTDITTAGAAPIGAGLVLIGGSIDPALERPFAIQRAADWPLVSWAAPRSLRQCNRELLTLRGDLERLQRQLPQLTVPLVMLHGGQDYQVPISNLEYLREQLATAGKENLFAQLIFPDDNHFIPWEHPEAVEAAIRMLIDRLSQRSVN